MKHAKTWFFTKNVFFHPISERSTCTRLHHSNLDSGDQIYLKLTKIFSAYAKTTCWCNSSRLVHCMFTGADPHMVQIGTGPSFWQINHANSAYFRLFLGYFQIISATRRPPFGSRPPFLHILDPPLCLCSRFQVYCLFFVILIHFFFRVQWNYNCFVLSSQFWHHRF